ncbi:MAG: hypothetical protein RMJ53_03120 [Chitinophagales bacterium]|nr:hypothetical protein [Chitinophagales bacterium]MDW8273202.1 hypothetical protein [Chitinophagales bacterium]
MKKIYPFLFIITLMVAGLSSCKKDYTCQCVASGGVARIIIPDATKQQAETICKSYEAYEQGQTGAITCELD